MPAVDDETDIQRKGKLLLTIFELVFSIKAN